MLNQHPPKFSLAPMAGFTDAAFRRICGSFGADYAVSEMISAAALTRYDRKTADLAKITAGEPPVVLQIFGREPETMARAADMLLSGDYPGCSYAAPPAGIDINMGCPMKKIVSNGEGCALMLHPDRAAAIVSAVREVCERHGVPASVKIRLGWDAEIAPSFARRMAEAGAERITVHCRTREQMYAPSADPSAAARVAEAIRDTGAILVGNGDVASPETAAVYLANGCREVAVGRAALGDPWLFRRLKHPEEDVRPTLEEIKSLVVSFVADVVRERGEVRGVRESRSRAAYFIKGMRGSAALRDRLNRAVTFDEFARAVEEWQEKE
ncbi:MAG: tRNA-dihydrouridine synthase family protein [Clostridia bacterium]|nr:tRNA-dihydrouridine synthase family protein [Clostridia bacterium]